MDSSTGWLARAPAELAEAHLAAHHALVALYQIRRLNENTHPTDEEWELRRQGRRDFDKWVKSYAETLVLLRDAVKKGRDSLRQVGEDFGAVAIGVAEFGGAVSHSYHRLAIDFAMGSALGFLDEASYFLSSIEGTTPIPGFWTFTVDEAARFIAPAAHEDPATLELLGIGEEDYKRLVARLQQEFFWAWKRKYPNDSVKYVTWADRYGGSEPPLMDPPLPRRPAYKRDQLWLTWKREGMTPAAIRDGWNAMTDDERRDVCPKKWQQIESEGGKEGERDLIEKALKRAEAESQPTGEN